MNKRCVQIKSGGRYIRFGCACAHSKDDRFKCGFNVLLSKSVAIANASSPWQVSAKTYSPHNPQCASRGVVTFREAAEFTTNTRTHLQSAASIKATKNRIAAHTRVAKPSISNHVAYRLRNHEANANNKNYDVNWAKMDKWGKDFMQLNAGSQFNLETDRKLRFKRCFVGMQPAAHVATEAGIEFSGLDATFFKHFEFRKGNTIG